MRTLCLWFACACLLVSTFKPVLAQSKKSGGASSSSNSSASGAQNSSSGQASSTATIESQMLAYGGLNLVSKSIAGDVCSNVDDRSTLIIFDQTTFGNIQAYAAFVASAQALFGHYQALASAYDDANGFTGQSTFLNRMKVIAGLHEHAADSIASNPKTNAKTKARKEHEKQFWSFFSAFGLTQSLDPFSDATSLLQAIAIASNTESGGAIVMPDSAVAVSLSQDLQTYGSCNGKNLQIIYPPLFGKASTSDYSGADIQSILQAVEDARTVIQHMIAENNQYLLAHQVPNGDPTLATMLSDTNGLYDSFMNSVLQVNSTTGVVGMASIIQGDELATLLAGEKNPPDPNDPSTDTGYKVPPANILLASVLGAGGTEHDHKTLWTALTTGDVITYSGGLIVNVSLWNATKSAPTFSRVFRYRAPFSNVADPKSMVDVTDGDNLQ